MSEAKVTDVNIDDWIDSAPLGRSQVGVAVLCGLIAMLDGFDTQSIAFVATTISKEWDIQAGTFGPVFAAGLLGLMVGQLILGPLADRRGRRGVILFCTLWFGAFTFATAYADSWNTLLGLRFLTGVGLGGAMPNIIALTSEYSPKSIRATLIAVMFGGFPLGAAIGGYVSSFIIPAYGWQSVFFLGGLIPILLLVPLYLYLPESLQHLTRSGGRTSVVQDMAIRLNPGKLLPENPNFVVQQQMSGKNNLLSLFQNGLTNKTLLLWMAYFFSLLMIYFLMSWLPVILNEAGMSLDKALYAAIALNIGGMLGGIALGTQLDRYNPYKVLAIGYLIAGVCIAGIGVSVHSSPLLMCIVFAAGFTVIGGQTAMHYIATHIYPSELRATGIGTALAVGRIGSIVGPVAGGYLISQSIPFAELFRIGSVPALAVAAAILLLMWAVKREV